MKRTVMIGAAAIAALAGTSYAQCGSQTSDAGWASGEAGACGGEHGPAVTRVAWEGPKLDLVETAVEAGQFTILAKALTAAGLVESLQGEGPFTVFAPTDEAFKKLPKGTLETLLKPEYKDQLVSILTYHVVSGNVMASEVVKLSNATTLNGQRVDIQTNAGGVMVDQAKVTATDVKASNGVIHVIDTVMLPESKDIVGVAAEAGSFGTLIAAAKAAGLVPALTGEGPLTVFAPTDEAFAALAPGTVESLLMPENREKLRSILLTHVVEGRVYSDQAAKLSEAKTAQGGMITIKPWNGTLKVGGASVVSADIEASNGVIHVIDRVILPN